MWCWAWHTVGANECRYGMKLLAAWLLRPHRGVGTEGFFMEIGVRGVSIKGFFYGDRETEH